MKKKENKEFVSLVHALKSNENIFHFVLVQQLGE